MMIPAGVVVDMAPDLTGQTVATIRRSFPDREAALAWCETILSLDGDVADLKAALQEYQDLLTELEGQAGP